MFALHSMRYWHRKQTPIQVIIVNCAHWEDSVNTIISCSSGDLLATKSTPCPGLSWHHFDYHIAGWLLQHLNTPQEHHLLVIQHMMQKQKIMLQHQDLHQEWSQRHRQMPLGWYLPCKNKSIRHFEFVPVPDKWGIETIKLDSYNALSYSYTSFALPPVF